MKVKKLLINCYNDIESKITNCSDVNSKKYSTKNTYIFITT